MEEIEEKRNKARKELENKKRERIEKATILEMSWSLARICKEILSEFPGEWDDIKEIERNEKMRQEDIEEKSSKRQKAKAKWQEKRNQQNITTMIEKLNLKSKAEWSKVIDEDEKKVRKEMQEMKENTWKWRSKQKVFRKDIREGLQTSEKIEILENIIRKEEKEKKERKEMAEIKSNEWRTIREEKAIEKKRKIMKKEMLEKAWADMRWALKEIEQSPEKWNEMESWTQTDMKKLNKKKQKFKKKYNKVKNNVEVLGTISELGKLPLSSDSASGLTPTLMEPMLVLDENTTTALEEMNTTTWEEDVNTTTTAREKMKTKPNLEESARRRRCESVLAGGGEMSSATTMDFTPRGANVSRGCVHK